MRTNRRGPKRRARLKRDEVRCGTCEQPLLAAAAAGFNGHNYHPIHCFDVALGEVKKRIAALKVAVSS